MFSSKTAPWKFSCKASAWHHAKRTKRLLLSQSYCRSCSSHAHLPADDLWRKGDSALQGRLHCQGWATAVAFTDMDMTKELTWATLFTFWTRSDLLFCNLLRWPWSYSCSHCSWGWVTPLVLASVLSLPWITASDLHTAISGMWPGWSPCLLKVTLIHSPSHWPDYIMRMCFITSLLIHHHHPAPIPDLHLCQIPPPRDLGFSHQQNMQSEALLKHQKSGFELRPYPYTPIISCLHTNAETKHISREGKRALDGRTIPRSRAQDPPKGEELHLKWFARNCFHIQTPHMGLKPTACSWPGPTPPHEYLCSRQRWKRDISS